MNWLELLSILAIVSDRTDFFLLKSFLDFEQKKSEFRILGNLLKFFLTEISLIPSVLKDIFSITVVNFQPSKVFCD